MNRAQRLLQQHHYVQQPGIAGVDDVAGEGVGAAREKRDVGLRNEPARALGSFASPQAK